MLNISDKELRDMLRKSSEKIDELGSRLLQVQSKIAQLRAEEGNIEVGIRVYENKLEAIKKAMLLNKGVPKKVLGMRKKLLAKIDRSRREDITIACKRTLDSEIQELQKEISRACNHPFVFHRDGFEGSSLYDYENGYPSERYCAVCGFDERAKDLRRDAVRRVANDFEVLKASEGRLIQREPYRQHPLGQERVNIQMPLGAVLHYFEDPVARMLNSRA